jgi:hypothetical protein
MISEQKAQSDSTSAAIANIARTAGMEELAKTWEKMEQINPPQTIVVRSTTSKSPGILISRGRNISEMDTFIQKMLGAIFKLHLTECINAWLIPQVESKLDWKEDEDRWALISSDRRILYEESSVPDLDTLRAAFARCGIKGDIELYRQYLQEHGFVPGIELQLAQRILPIRPANEPFPDFLQSEDNEEFAIESAKMLSRIIRESPEIMLSMPSRDRSVFGGLTVIQYDSEKSAVESLLKPMLTCIESLLERKPSAQFLWEQWIFWNSLEESPRPLESLLDRIKPSPFSGEGILGLPRRVVDFYFNECKKNGRWDKVVALLRAVWDGEYQQWTMLKGYHELKARMGDEIGEHLIEAYLQDGRPGDADDIFKAAIDYGAKFKNISKIVALAKAKGLERMANEWQAANDKQAPAPAPR